MNGRIAAAKGRLQRVLTEQVQSRQSMNNKTIKKEKPSFMLADAPYALSTGFRLRKEHSPEFCMPFFNTVEVVLKLEDESLSEFILTAYDVHKLLPQ